ncbi:DEAD/DEAH box helicase [Rhodoferax sp. U11-2br]|uniref:DEAD/DEAH box helicase n=1 Tax=Rhodoferax sp. U11-2br TaxID=2838878 RepID=UPI001BE7F99A|nr:DEAD/DEAH box helicase [Rhodoferax sp. U11-2br]MBT3068553.1 DEAD/DEAH box helicase [Rhodoferax sp. U11-2br]
MKEAIDILLKIELRAAVESIGLKSTSQKDLITEVNLYKVINAIECAILKNEESKKIAAMCALLWTHFHKHFNLLGEYINSAMTRIGFSPVSKMLQGEDGKIVNSSLASTLEEYLQSQKYTIETLGKKLIVTEFQKRLWDELERSPRVAVSAPTSAGKSYLLCLRAVHNAAQHGGVSFYIVPTVTLMNQVATDLFAISRESGVKIRILTTVDENITAQNGAIFFVLTQERITERLDFLNNGNFSLTQLIIDEVQNIERAFDIGDSNSRAKMLIDVIIDLHDRFSPRLSVVSGPRISDIRSMAASLFNQPVSEQSTTSSPVVNIAYSITPTGKCIEVKQFSELSSNHLSEILDNTIGATGFSKKTYSDSFHEYLFNVVVANKGGLIFSPTSGQCRKTALSIARRLHKSKNQKIHSLAEYIKTTVSPSYDLAECIESKVAFHHGKLPPHIRNALEFAIGQSIIDHVVCTTTLMQGVNIPAKTVVLRNPNLFIRDMTGVKPTLSNYEIANLRGRAGRLLRDFVGRTFILDGTSFEEVEVQSSLFKPEDIKIDGSYAKVFEENRGEIVHALTSRFDNFPLNSVASYIASAIYTEKFAQPWLARKGITLSMTEINEIKGRMKKLVVSEAVCKRFRYWNPFELNLIAQSADDLRLPISIFSTGLGEQLEELINKINQIIPERTKKYVGGKNLTGQVIPIFSSNAARWAKEIPLFEILSNSYSRKSADNTESTINMLQKDIAFGLPSLLGPAYAIKEADSSLLSFMERGAYSKEVRLLINANIPREIAISTNAKMKQAKRPLNDISDAIRFIEASKLPYWEAVHFKHLVDLNSIIAG